MIDQTNLDTLGGAVSAPDGVIYSTSPKRAEGADSFSYFVKGPSQEIVFAELAGCLLAREVGLLVPDVAACAFDNDIYCGSQKAK